MSQALRQLAIDTFRENAELAYQTGSKLRDRVTVASGITGESHRFPIFGSTDAERRASQADVTPANLGNKRPTALLEPFESFDYLDLQDNAITNVDAMRQYGIVHGRAVARQFDEPIIAALQTYDANAYSRAGLAAALSFKTGVAPDSKAAGVPNGFTSAHIAEAMAMLMDEMDDSDPEDCTLVYPARRFDAMAGDVKLASMDYMQGTGSPGVTKTGGFMSIYGCKPVFIGQNARRTGHGRLPDNRAYLFHRRAIGLATGTVENLGVVAKIEQKRSWLIGAEANAGATRINNGGVIEIRLEA